MPLSACFLHSSSLTLLHPASRHSTRLTRTHVAPARISTTFCLATKRRTQDSTSSQSPKSAADDLGSNSLTPVAFDPADPLHGDDIEDEEDPGLVEPDEENIAEWAGDSEEEDVPLEDLILSASQADSGLHDDDEFIGPEFREEDDEDEDEDSDEDSDEDDEDDADDDAEQLTAADEFDAYNEDVTVPVVVKSRSKISSPTIDLSDDEEPDDSDSDNLHVLMEPPADNLDPLFEGEDEEPSIVDIAAEQNADTLGDETDDEIEDAANILSKSGLLGLGNKRTLADTSDSKQVLSPAESQLEGDEDLFDEEDEDDIEGSLDRKKKEGKESEYLDYEDEEDEDFGAPKTKFGKVWELNDDCYVTITEPGESYAYELDPEDEEDQEMATMRRGKQGGWSGGLASYPSTDLVEGSKEWVARRSYELMTKASAKEMLRWTRWRTDPPDSIKEIFPADPAPAPVFGKTELNQTLPMDALEGQEEADEQQTRELAFVDTRDQRSASDGDGNTQETALDRSIKFPAMHTFKVEGLGEGFLDSLQRTVEYALNRPVPDLQMEVEPSGRYERVIIRLEVKNSSQVTNIYDALRNNPMVKFSYG